MGEKISVDIIVDFRDINHVMGSYYYEYRGVQDENVDIEMRLLSRQEALKKSQSNNNVCTPSISFANGKRVACMGTELFFDDFSDNELKPDKWKVEKRIAGEPDDEFVIYESSSIKTGTPNGLRIEPNLRTVLYGNNSLYRNYTVQDCTAARDDPLDMGCFYNRNIHRNNMAPPIVSSQITTSGLFSFQYGRIEIEAKLPRGRWIVPQLWLQPHGDKYNRTGYKAGLVTIAKVDNSGHMSGIVLVQQGVVLGAEEPIRSLFLSQRIMDSRWEMEFHKFVVEWRPGLY